MEIPTPLTTNSHLHCFALRHAAVPVLGFAAAFPSVYTRLLEAAAEFAREQKLGSTGPSGAPAALGNTLKAYGCPLFIIGHLLITKNNASLDSMDWSYIAACVALGKAFWDVHKGDKKIVPEMVLLSGLFLVLFGTLGRLKCQAAGVSPTLANVAAAAGGTLVYMAVQMLMMRHGVLSQPLPGLSLAQLGQVASCLFGFANFTKYFQLLQAGTPWNEVRVGQFLKITASTCLATGNALILDWQKVKVPGSNNWTVIGMFSAFLLAANGLKA